MNVENMVEKFCDKIGVPTTRENGETHCRFRATTYSGQEYVVNIYTINKSLKIETENLEAPPGEAVQSIGIDSIRECYPSHGGFYCENIHDDGIEIIPRETPVKAIEISAFAYKNDRVSVEANINIRDIRKLKLE